jgi:2-keto-3-deoxy-L-rhamnonate aldolase RhmA
MKNFQLKKKLAENIVTLGSWITLGHSAIAEIMANAGFDWLVVDLEHSVTTIEQAAEQIRVIELSGVPPLVRLTSNDPNQIKRVMDAGAHGIIVPNVNTAEEAEKAVASVRYAPMGRRGVGLARAQKYGVGFDEYLKWVEEESVVVAQIEHKDALPNLNEIFTTPGIDAYIIGPYDLTCSMGIPGQFQHPDFLKAIEKIRAMGAEVGISGGLHIVEPDKDRLKQCLEDGYQFIAYSVDFRILDVGLRQGLNHFKEFKS